MILLVEVIIISRGHESAQRGRGIVVRALAVLCRGHTNASRCHECASTGAIVMLIKALSVQNKGR